IPRLGLGADVIVGFPGETAEDFAATRTLIEALPFSYLHVFPYSARPGTEAARLPDRVDARTVTERGRILRDVAAAQGRRVPASLVDRVEEVVGLETRGRARGGLGGLTGHYGEGTVPRPRRPRGPPAGGRGAGGR